MGRKIGSIAKFSDEIAWIVQRPIAHRALHDKRAGRYENTLSAARAAIEKGFSIELDLHPSADGVPMVFHDLKLDRLTGEKGSIRQKTANQLRKISIAGSSDHIPTLAELLETVGGSVGLVMEMKGVAGEDDGFVEAVGDALRGYGGNAALMSFNHWLVEDARRLASSWPVGLTAAGGDRFFAVHDAIARKADVDFVAYAISDLPCNFVRQFRTSGKPVISWTITTPGLATKSARYADQITFEGFDPVAA